MLEGGVYWDPFLAPMMLGGGDWDGVMLEGGGYLDPFPAPMELGDGDWDGVMLEGGGYLDPFPAPMMLGDGDWDGVMLEVREGWVCWGEGFGGVSAVVYTCYDLFNYLVYYSVSDLFHLFPVFCRVFCLFSALPMFPAGSSPSLAFPTVVLLLQPLFHFSFLLLHYFVMVLGVVKEVF